jgi:hypothetical protein
LSCCGEGRRQASQTAASGKSARPGSLDTLRGSNQLRIARFEALTIPLTLWVAGVVALVVWGWSVRAIIKMLCS